MPMADPQGHIYRDVRGYGNSRLHLGDNIYNGVELDLEIKCLHLLASNYREDKDRNEIRVPGTCEWFLGNEKFLRWHREEMANLLWVSADPGCGKSVLSRALVDEGLLTTVSRRTSICYFFFKDDDVNRRTGANSLCAVLHQLFTQKPVLLKYAVPHYRNNGNLLRTMFSTLWDILKKAATDPEAGEIICVLDVLDECEESAMEVLIRTLGNFYSGQIKKNSRLKFLVTSRPYYYIECAFGNTVKDLTSISLKGEDESEKISEEIDLVIQHEILCIASSRRPPLEPGVRDGLVEHLRSMSHRTYLWLHLILDVIRKTLESTPGRLKNLVDKVPLSVDDAYERILKRIKDSEQTEQARRLLNIIVVAARPLTLKEMNFALAIGEKIEREEICQSYDDLELDGEQQFKIKLRNLCGLFVSIVDSKIFLIHQTAKEFLICKGVVKDPCTAAWKHSLELGESNLILVKICISYLLFDVFENQPLAIDIGFNIDVSEEIDRYTERHHFLDYAAKHWAVHFRGARINRDTALLKSALGVCYTRSQRFLTWFQVYWTTIQPYCWYWEDFSDLTVGSHFGHDVIVKYLLEKEGVDVNHKDGWGRTPLSWAAEGGHLKIVKLLATREEVDVNHKDTWGRTPLSWAAEGGHLEIAKVLAAREDVDVNPKGDDGGGGLTPLSWAAKGGHLGIVKLLAAKEDIDVNHKDGWGRTPLSWAAEGGHLEIVKLLAAREEADVNSKDTWGRTPLSWAAEGGHLEIAKVLAVREDVDVNPKGDGGDGRTPLSCAAKRGHLGIVKLLVAKEDIDVNHKDGWGRTPLSWAAEGGHLEMVKLLAAREDVDVNPRDRWGRTPLWWAAKGGHLEIVRLLTAREDLVDMNPKDDDGWTPLSWAVKGGHLEIVKLLVAKEGIDVNHKDGWGRTPLSWAAEGGHLEMVKLLAVREEAGVDSKDTWGRTPLSWAAEGGHLEIAKVLAARKDVDVNSRGDDGADGRTPLSWAAKGGHPKIAKLLAAREDVDANHKDGWGRTPLSWAAEGGHLEIVKLLSAREDVDVNPKDRWGRTPLWWAAKGGHLEIVKLLAAREDVDVNPKDDDGWTPLWWAAKGGHLEIVKLLLAAREDVDVNSKDTWGRTPLSWAAEGGHLEIVGLLEKRKTNDLDDTTIHPPAHGHGT